MVKDLIARIVEGIMRQEGRPADDPNPGDVRDPVWFPGLPPFVVDTGGAYRVLSRRKYFDGASVAYRLQLSTHEAIWVPRSRVEGVAAIAREVAMHVGIGDSLRSFLAGSAHYPGYAHNTATGSWSELPAGDKNDVDRYVADLKEWAAIPDENRPLWEFLL